MTTLALPRRHSDASLASGLTASFFLVFNRILRRRAIRNDRKLLQAMPDYLLSDIGIGRGDIDRAVEFGRGAADFR